MYHSISSKDVYRNKRRKKKKKKKDDLTLFAFSSFTFSRGEH